MYGQETSHEKWINLITALIFLVSQKIIIVLLLHVVLNTWLDQWEKVGHEGRNVFTLNLSQF